MKNYHYDEVTKEYLSETAALENPQEKGKFLCPLNATHTEPPKSGDGEAVRWSGTRWEVVTDLRGKEYWLKDGSRHEITHIGTGLPDDALDNEPPPSLDDYRVTVKTNVVGYIDDLLSIFTSDTPLTERLSWSSKAAAARALLGGVAIDQQEAMLQAEAALFAPDDIKAATTALAQKIVANAAVYEVVIARAAGLRKIVFDGIDSADSINAVDAILDSAKAQAKAMLAEITSRGEEG